MHDSLHDPLKLAPWLLATVRTASRFALGIASSEEIQQTARTCLDAGIWSPDIDEMLADSVPIHSTVGPAFERFLATREIALPTPKEAVWRLLRLELGAIAEGDVPPRAGMAAVVEAYATVDASEQAQDAYVGASHGLEHLLGAYYDYDELDERPLKVSVDGLYGGAAVAALGGHIVALANQWIEADRNTT